ncbi:MAG: MAPEG family protein [Betaproteobacteria bacterium]
MHPPQPRHWPCGHPPHGHRAVRADYTPPNNLAISTAVMGIAQRMSATNGRTPVAGIVVLTARMLHAMIHMMRIPYPRSAVFAVGQLPTLACV